MPANARTDGTIAAYLGERETIDSRWAEFSERSRLADLAANEEGLEPDGPRDYGLLKYRAEMEACEVKHFGDYDRPTGGGIKTPAQLWRWIVSRALLWESPAKVTALQAGFGDPHVAWNDLVATYRHLDRLNQPGATRPPYQMLSEADSLTMLWRVANELEKREAESRPEWANDEAIARERGQIVKLTEAIEQLEKKLLVTLDRKTVVEIIALRDHLRRQIECHKLWLRNADLDPDPPAPATAPPAGKATAERTPTPRRFKQRDESVKAMIQACRESGLWGITPGVIARRSEIPLKSLYRILQKPSVKPEWDRYKRESAGKPPARPDEL